MWARRMSFSVISARGFPLSAHVRRHEEASPWLTMFRSPPAALGRQPRQPHLGSGTDETPGAIRMISGRPDRFRYTKIASVTAICQRLAKATVRRAVR